MNVKQFTFAAGIPPTVLSNVNNITGMRFTRKFVAIRMSRGSLDVEFGHIIDILWCYWFTLFVHFSLRVKKNLFFFGPEVVFSSRLFSPTIIWQTVYLIRSEIQAGCKILQQMHTERQQQIDIYEGYMGSFWKKNARKKDAYK